MSRKRNHVPKYCRMVRGPHEYAYCKVRDPKTDRLKQVMLGAWNSEESKQKYARVLAEVQTELPTATPEFVTVSAVAAGFYRHALDHYRRADGSQTNERVEYRDTIKVLAALYGGSDAREFGPNKLRTVREAMVQKGWARTTVNNRARRIRHIFKWAVGRELVPASVLVGLQAVEPLQAGRTTAREPEPIQPVSEATVEATLPHLTRHVAGLVRFQMLTGCRPGEACLVRRDHIDTTGEIWVFRPDQHKTKHKGKERVILIGPRAQAVLAEFPTQNPTDYVFSPKTGQKEKIAARAAARKTKRWPSHAKAKAAKIQATPERTPGERYTTHAYDHAIAKAAAKAGVCAWAPNQLRHLVATKIRERFSLEHSQHILGHTKDDMTRRYAQKSLTIAQEIAHELG